MRMSLILISAAWRQHAARLGTLTAHECRPPPALFVLGAASAAIGASVATTAQSPVATANAYAIANRRARPARSQAPGTTLASAADASVPGRRLDRPHGRAVDERRVEDGRHPRRPRGHRRAHGPSSTARSRGRASPAARSRQRRPATPTAQACRDSSSSAAGRCRTSASASQTGLSSRSSRRSRRAPMPTEADARVTQDGAPRHAHGGRGAAARHGDPGGARRRGDVDPRTEARRRS